MQTNEEFEKKKDLNYLIISNQNLNTNNQIKIDEFPIEYSNLIDTLNIAFLKKKIEIKKDVKIGKFTINYNSRKLYKDKEFINLTEKDNYYYLNNSKTCNIMIYKERFGVINKIRNTYC